MALINCPECGKEVSDKAEVCIHCGYPIADHFKPKSKAYRWTLFGGKKQVFCPKCKSDNCSEFQENVNIPAKTKTQYSANLNPLKPFTLVNKKEKVVSREVNYTQKKFRCNDCGAEFY